MLGAVLYPFLALILNATPIPDPPHPTTPPLIAEQGVTVEPRITAATDATWTYPEPPITIEAPKPPPKHHTTPVVHRYAPGARANLGGVYEAGVSVIGTPYVAGGKTPAGFDCSGFVSWAYRWAGVSIPSSVDGIRARGTVISAADARPGDILYWPGHVALYAGSGKRLDANRPGSTVSVRAIYGTPVYLRIG